MSSKLEDLLPPAKDFMKKLASAEARSATLEKVHNALLQRVAPEAKAPGA